VSVVFRHLSGMQIASFQCRYISSFVVCPAVPRFYTLAYERNDFGGETLLDMKMFFFKFPLHLLSEKFLIVIRIRRDTVKNVHKALMFTDIEGGT
jgi:hypothetical protein